LRPAPVFDAGAVEAKQHLASGGIHGMKLSVALSKENQVSSDQYSRFCRRPLVYPLMSTIIVGISIVSDIDYVRTATVTPLRLKKCHAGR